MEHITVQINEKLFKAAQKQAQAEGLTLDDVVRIWLELYVQGDTSMQRYGEVLAEVRGKMRVGRKLARDETNER